MKNAIFFQRLAIWQVLLFGIRMLVANKFLVGHWSIILNTAVACHYRFRLRPAH